MRKEHKMFLKKLFMIVVQTKLLLTANEIGKNCFVGKRLSINNARYLTLKEGVRIGNDARISFYENFNGQKLYPELMIGENSYIGNHFTVLSADKVKIGKNVLIASYVMISSENHGIDPESDLGYGKQSLITKPVIIDDGVWIGEKVSILPGVTIGKKSIIGTGSVVTNSVPPYTIVVGIPAKVIKKYNFQTKEWEKIGDVER